MATYKWTPPSQHQSGKRYLQSPDQIQPNPAPDQIMMPGLGPPGMRPLPPTPPRPPDTNIPLPTPSPQLPPGGGGGNIPGPPKWFGFGGDNYGVPGGQIGPPEQNQSNQGYQIPGADANFYNDFLESYWRSQGMNWQPTQPEYPGLNQPAPYPLERPGPSDPWGETSRPRIRFPDEGNQGPARPSPNIGVGRRPGRGQPQGPMFPPMGGGMGGGMRTMPGLSPPPYAPPRITGPYVGGSIMYPEGTNPWDIPGARVGGSPMLPPGTPIPPGGEDISARIEGDRQEIERRKEAFRDYVAGGGDPYGPTTPDWMNYNRRKFLL